MKLLILLAVLLICSNHSFKGRLSHNFGDRNTLKHIIHRYESISSKKTRKVNEYSFLLKSFENSDMSNEVRQKLEESDFEGAMQIIKRNPMIQLSSEDGRILLNNLESLTAENSVTGNYQQEAINQCSLLYKRLEKLKILKGFGCVDGEYPDKSVGEISPEKLLNKTGIDVSALTPKQRSNYWRLAGIVLCLTEILVGEKLGINPLYTLVPATFAIFTADQLFYRGAGFESIYQTLFPEYRKKIIYHEAGHFLVSYLLGIPVRGCVTNAWDARKYPEIKGQAGTIFYDTRLAEELGRLQVLSVL